MTFDLETDTGMLVEMGLVFVCLKVADIKFIEKSKQLVDLHSVLMQFLHDAVVDDQCIPTVVQEKCFTLSVLM
jgi:hypothetical protein